MFLTFIYFNIYTSPTFLSPLSFHLPTTFSIFLPLLPFHLPTTYLFSSTIKLNSKPFQFRFRVLCELFQLKGREKKKKKKRVESFQALGVFFFFYNFPIIIFNIFFFNIYTSLTFLYPLPFHLSTTFSIFLPLLPFHLPTTPTLISFFLFPFIFLYFLSLLIHTLLL